MSGIPPVPFGDAKALEAWVHLNRAEVTPVILGRLLEHNGFKEVVELPTRTRVRLIVYAPIDRWRDPSHLARYEVRVYNTERVTPVNLEAALTILRLIRAWRVRNPLPRDNEEEDDK